MSKNIVILPGGSSNFLDLTDTPDSYYGYGGQSFVVNDSETGIDFFDVFQTFATIEDLANINTNTSVLYGGVLVGDFSALNFTGDVDVSDAGSGQVNINFTATGSGSSNFLDLSDTPNSYVGSANYFLRVNSNPNAIEFVDATTLFQPLDATLTALAGLTTAADQMIYSTGSDTFAMTSLTSFARTLLDDANATAARSTLGVDASGTDNSTNVTLAGSYDYLTLLGQQITLGQIDLTTDVTGTLPVGNGGLGISSFTTGDILYASNSSTLSKLGIGSPGYVLKVSGGLPAWAAESGGPGSSTFLDLLDTPDTFVGYGGYGVRVSSTEDFLEFFDAFDVFQPLDATLTALAGLTTAADQMIYSTGSDTFAMTSLTSFARTLLDDADQATTQTTLGVDPAGTDNSTDVTLSGSYDYITIVGQVITRNQIDLTTDVTGTLPVGNGGTGTSTTFTQGSVIFAGASGVYTQDNANFFWNDSSNKLGLGTTDPSGILTIAHASNSYQVIHQAGNNASGPTLNLIKSRGTVATPTVGSSNDAAGQLTWSIHDGTVYDDVASIQAIAVDITAGDVDGQISFYVATDSVLNEVLILSKEGNLTADGSVTGSNLSGTNTGDVTLAGSYDYLTISSQQITLGQIDLATDVTGTLPIANGGTNQTSFGTVGGVVFYNGTSLTVDADFTFSADSLALNTTIAANTQFNIIGDVVDTGVANGLVVTMSSAATIGSVAISGSTSDGAFSVIGVQGTSGGTSDFAVGTSGLSTATGAEAFGVSGQATGAATTNYGGYFSAENASTNYGIYVNAGSVYIGGLSGSDGLVSITSGVLGVDTNSYYYSGGTDVAVTDGGTGLSSWTANGILYASATTTLTNTSNFVYTSGKLGIGTSGPAYTISLDDGGSDYDTAMSITARRRTSSYNNSAIIFNGPRSDTADGSTGGGRGMILLLGNSSTTAGALWINAATASLATTADEATLQGYQSGIELNSTGYINLWRSGTQYGKFNGSGDSWISGGGFLGINTSSPAQELDVCNASSATASIAVENDEIIRNDGTSIYMGGVDASGHTVVLRYNGADKITIGTSYKLNALTSNGFVKTSGGDGTLSVDTNSYYYSGGTDVAVTDGGTGISSIAQYKMLYASAADTLAATSNLSWNESTLTVTGTVAATTVTGANVTSGSDPGHTHTAYQPLDAELTAIAGLSTGIVTITGAGTASARTITGTSNKIDVSNGDGVSGNPTITISATYVGQTSITTLGTIGTGVWSGTAIDVTKGGTGLTTVAAGSILAANTLDTLSAITSTSGLKVLQNSSGTITWATVTGTGSPVYSTSPGFTTAANPASNDGAALGTTALMWSDLFLASGSVVNFNNGDITLTHSADTLTFNGGTLALGANPITMTSGYIAIGTDPADAGSIRLANAGIIGWEVNPAGTDKTLTVNSANTFVFNGDLSTNGIYNTTRGTGGFAARMFGSGTNLIIDSLYHVDGGSGKIAFYTYQDMTTWAESLYLDDGSGDLAITYGELLEGSIHSLQFSYPGTVSSTGTRVTGCPIVIPFPCTVEYLKTTVDINTSGTLTWKVYKSVEATPSTYSDTLTITDSLSSGEYYSSVSGGSYSLAAGDKLRLDITAVSGTISNLCVVLIVRKTASYV